MSVILSKAKLRPLGAPGRGLILALTTLPYLRPLKLANILRCEAEKHARASRTRSSPYVAIVDITNTCNLQCPYCPTGERRESGRKRTMIDPRKLEEMLSELGPYLITANLFNWGEPLLHPKIGEIVEMFHKKGIATFISTNLNIKDKGLLEELVEKGLDYLTVSMSGASQGTYQVYHRKGNLDLVMENLKHLTQYKQKKKTTRPRIEIKYLLFNHNRHEVRTARKAAEKLRIDIFRPVRGGGAEEATLDIQEAPRRYVKIGFCHQLWHVMLINADGGIAPCCYLFYKADDFAMYPGESTFSIRNNERFVTARKLFNSSASKDLPPDLEHPCLKCIMVHEQPHLKHYLESNPNAHLSHRTGGP